MISRNFRVKGGKRMIGRRFRVSGSIDTYKYLPVSDYLFEKFAERGLNVLDNSEKNLEKLRDTYLQICMNVDSKQLKALMENEKKENPKNANKIYEDAMFKVASFHHFPNLVKGAV